MRQAYEHSRPGLPIAMGFLVVVGAAASAVMVYLMQA